MLQPAVQQKEKPKVKLQPVKSPPKKEHVKPAASMNQIAMMQKKDSDDIGDGDSDMEGSIEDENLDEAARPKATHTAALTDRRASKQSDQSIQFA